MHDWDLLWHHVEMLWNDRLKSIKIEFVMNFRMIVWKTIWMCDMLYLSHGMLTTFDDKQKSNETSLSR